MVARYRRGRRSEPHDACQPPHRRSPSRISPAQGTQPGSQRSYKNANYALLRITNAFMWRALDHKLYGTVPGKPGKPTVKYVLPVDAKNHAKDALDFMQQQIFTPAGLGKISCKAEQPSTAGRNYPAGAGRPPSARSWRREMRSAPAIAASA